MAPVAAGKVKGPFSLKNKEAEERRRPSLHYVDFADLVVFTREDLAREMAKIPELKLRSDEDGILSRIDCLKRLPSLIPTGDPLNVSPSDNKSRRRSSALSIVSSASRSTSPIGSQNFGSFFELAKALSKIDTNQPEPYPFPDAVPPALRFIEIKDIIHTDIDWKMLTTVRPGSKIDEDFYTRFLECARLHEKLKQTEGHKSKFRFHPRSKLGLKFRSSDLSDDLLSLHLNTDHDYDDFARVDLSEVNECTNDTQENANELVAKLLGEDDVEMITENIQPTNGASSTPLASTSSADAGSSGSFVEGKKTTSNSNSSSTAKTTELGGKSDKFGGKNLHETFDGKGQGENKGKHSTRRVSFETSPSPSSSSPASPSTAASVGSSRASKGKGGKTKNAILVAGEMKKRRKVKRATPEGQSGSGGGKSNFDPETNEPSVLSATLFSRNKFASGIVDGEAPKIVITTFTHGNS